MKSACYPIALLIIILTGCSTTTSGNKLASSSIHNIKAGVSTKEDVVSIVGTPAVKNSSIDGSSIWKYTYIKTQSKVNAMSFVPIVGNLKGGSQDSSGQILTITFNKSNIVSKCVFLVFSDHGTGIIGSMNKEEERSETVCEDVRESL